MRINLTNAKCVLGFLLFCSLVQGQNKYQKVRIFYTDVNQVSKIIEQGQIDHFKEKKGDYIECDLSSDLVANFKQSGYKVEIIQSDLDLQFRTMQAENTIVSSCTIPDIVTPTNYRSGSMSGYLSYQEILLELDKMRDLYPNLITTKASISNFTTVEGRPIHFVKISDNPSVDENEKRVFYNALTHAREPGSMQQLIYYMWYLLENYATNPEIKALVDHSEIYFVPVVNPDGYSYLSNHYYWRKNRKKFADGNYGVDLNRNYDAHWGTVGISTNTADEIYCGTAPFSEVETQAVKWLATQKNFSIVINSHSYSSLILHPSAYTFTPTPDNLTFTTISSEMVKYNNYKNQTSSTLYLSSGGANDWFYDDVSSKPKAFSFTAEVGLDFWESDSQTLVNNKHMIHTNLTALRAIHNYANFEDNTPYYFENINFIFNYSLERIGLVDQTDFKIKLIPVSSNITIQTDSNTHSNLAMGQSVTSDLNLTVNPTIKQGEAIVFKIEIDNGVYKDVKTITKFYNSPDVKFVDDFSTLNWKTTGNWGLTNSEFYSSNSAITDSPIEDYGANVGSSIQTINAINLKDVSTASLSFFAKWNLEKGYDYVQIEISSDNGASWQPKCGKYTSIGTSAQGKLNLPLYDGQQSNWVKEEMTLDEFVGKDILVRFIFKSDYKENYDGFYLDDFKVIGFANPNLSVPNNVISDTIVFPNPASEFLFISNNLPVDFYTIYNDLGQFIDKGEVKNAKIDVSNLSNGIYFLTLKKDNFTKQSKFIIKK